jgi:hypothetical protein
VAGLPGRQIPKLLVVPPVKLRDGGLIARPPTHDDILNWLGLRHESDFNERYFWVVTAVSGLSSPFNRLSIIAMQKKPVLSRALFRAPRRDLDNGQMTPVSAIEKTARYPPSCRGGMSLSTQFHPVEQDTGIRCTAGQRKTA